MDKKQNDARDFWKKIHLTVDMKKITREDILNIQFVTGRGLYEIFRTLRGNSGEIVKTMKDISRSGIPAIGFAKEEDKKHFLANYPKISEMLSRISNESKEKCAEILSDCNDDLYMAFTILIPDSQIAQDIKNQK